MDAHACIQVGRGGACMREELMSWLGPSTIDDRFHQINTYINTDLSIIIIPSVHPHTCMHAFV